MMREIKIGMSGSLSEDGSVSVNQNYLKAVRCSGGLPILLEPIADERHIKITAQVCDGFVFCGGGDIAPSFYGEMGSERIKNVCAIRDRFEQKLFDAAYASGKPIFGICRGMQVINVFLGGSLIQHIDGHMQAETGETKTHEVSVAKGSLLWNVIQKKALSVNSFHHQAINRLSDRLYIDAKSALDGYIEAYHLDGYGFLLGVQWHPESLYSSDESSKSIFDAFIKACMTAR